MTITTIQTFRTLMSLKHLLLSRKPMMKLLKPHVIVGERHKLSLLLIWAGERNNLFHLSRCHLRIIRLSIRARNRKSQMRGAKSGSFRMFLIILSMSNLEADNR